MALSSLQPCWLPPHRFSVSFKNPQVLLLYWTLGEKRNRKKVINGFLLPSFRVAGLSSVMHCCSPGWYNEGQSGEDSAEGGTLSSLTCCHCDVTEYKGWHRRNKCWHCWCNTDWPCKPRPSPVFEKLDFLSCHRQTSYNSSPWCIYFSFSCHHSALTHVKAVIIIINIFPNWEKISPASFLMHEFIHICLQTKVIDPNIEKWNIFLSFLHCRYY